MQTQTKNIAIIVGLVALMAITRSGHFGTAIHLPDASLAIFLIAGFLLPRYTWAALAIFALLLLEAGGIDYYAINYRDVSDYCVSPAYWFLIPTYASMWLSGRWLATQQLHNNWRALALFTGASWLATSAAFLISNGSFYLFSGRFNDMSIAEYASRVAKYYPPYLSSTMMYLTLAVVAYAIWAHLSKVSTQPSQH